MLLINPECRSLYWAGLYDAPDSGRFFITAMFYTCTSLERPDCSNKNVFSYVLVAVSKSSNPLDGFQGPFYVDTSGVDPFDLQVC